MRIRFLGTGAATACPLPFCRCEVCKAARQNGGRDYRRRSSLLIDDELLIDMGPDFMSAAGAMDIDTTRIRYWLQTHSHSDHFDAGHLHTRIREYATVNVPPLELVASEACLAHMSAWLDREESGADLLDPGMRERLALTVKYAVHAETRRVGPYLVTPLATDHDKRDQSMMFLIERDGRRLLYALDTGVFSREVMECITSGVYLDALIIDHTYGWGSIDASSAPSTICALRTASAEGTPVGIPDDRDIACPPGDPPGGQDHLNAPLVADTLRALRKSSTINTRTRVWASHISHEGVPKYDTFAVLAREQGYEVAYDGLDVLI